ncbi:zinc finger MYM-type protein 1-like [Heracleum sosnowskyi]|uniref:Zinc finger MYM-type protein 1-like n=1 Tax=Heracleum sosnowskyi TaxID=360622 RepID=A0AAD8N282_9APIA|nr:zinc finger MYM-type protein 1-like [Heracleum sosnowskyi]
MATQGKKRGKTLLSFFKPSASTPTNEVHPPSNIDIEENPSSVDIEENQCDQPIFKSLRVEIDLNTLERDPGIRKPIWQHPVNQRDEIRQAYFKMGAYQPKLVEYPRTKYGSQTQHRRFQYSWFDKFRWLEYSPEKNAVFCFPCFIFENKSPLHPAFTTDGFNYWKRVNDGVRCPFLIHVGTPTSPHSNDVQNCEELMKVTGHIDKVLNAQSLEEVQKNRLRLKASIESVRWLSLQACEFRGHDEAPTSSKRGERDTGRGINQIGNLHKSGSTRWSSHFDSIWSLIDMYGATISVLGSIVEEGNSTSLRGEETVMKQLMSSYAGLLVFLLFCCCS